MKPATVMVAGFFMRMAPLPPTAQDDCRDRPMGPVIENHVIASRKAAWQSASPAMHSIARPL